jgi:hypothetical protein
MARRRKQDAGERRTAALRLQLTPTERAEIDRRAAAFGRRVSDFGRTVLLSDLKAPAPPARDRASVQGVRAQIRHAGNNLNQLTHIANQRGDLPSQKLLAAAIEEVVAALRKVRDL